ncbi:MAG TPA: hypothetical protein VFE35_01200 [Candidatus Cybelea sp.]|jgi:hypothetical protein|nr:hypothetical protein [Candidatus Cybelea sp.]
MRTIALLTLFGITLSGLVACSSNKAGNAANNAAQTAASAAGAMGNAANGAMAGKPNCGAVQAVWVNLNTKVYHEPGDPVYGKTKHGEYLCPSQAQAQGFRPAGGAMKHHRKGSSSTM